MDGNPASILTDSASKFGHRPAVKLDGSVFNYMLPNGASATDVAAILASDDGEAVVLVDLGHVVAVGPAVLDRVRGARPARSSSARPASRAHRALPTRCLR